MPHYLNLSSMLPSPDLPRWWAMPQIRRAPAHHFFFQSWAVFHIVFAFGLSDAWWTRPVNCGNDRLRKNWMAYNWCSMIQMNLNGIRWMYTCTYVLVVRLLGCWAFLPKPCELGWLIQTWRSNGKVSHRYVIKREGWNWLLVEHE